MTEHTTPKCPKCGEYTIPKEKLNKWYCPKCRELLDPKDVKW